MKKQNIFILTLAMLASFKAVCIGGMENRIKQCLRGSVVHDDDSGSGPGSASGSISEDLKELASLRAALATAEAKGTRTDDLEKQIAELQKELSRLQSAQGAGNPPPPPAPAKVGAGAPPPPPAPGMAAAKPAVAKTALETAIAAAIKKVPAGVAGDSLNVYKKAYNGLYANGLEKAYTDVEASEKNEQLNTIIQRLVEALRGGPSRNWKSETAAGVVARLRAEITAEFPQRDRDVFTSIDNLASKSAKVESEQARLKYLEDYIEKHGAIAGAAHAGAKPAAAAAATAPTAKDIVAGIGGLKKAKEKRLDELNMKMLTAHFEKEAESAYPGNAAAQDAYAEYELANYILKNKQSRVYKTVAENAIIMRRYEALISDYSDAADYVTAKTAVAAA